MIIDIRNAGTEPPRQNYLCIAVCDHPISRLFNVYFGDEEFIKGAGGTHTVYSCGRVCGGGASDCGPCGVLSPCGDFNGGHERCQLSSSVVNNPDRSIGSEFSESRASYSEFHSDAGSAHFFIHSGSRFGQYPQVRVGSDDQSEIYGGFQAGQYRGFTYIAVRIRQATPLTERGFLDFNGTFAGKPVRDPRHASAAGFSSANPPTEAEWLGIPQVYSNNAYLCFLDWLCAFDYISEDDADGDEVVREKRHRPGGFLHDWNALMSIWDEHKKRIDTCAEKIDGVGDRYTFDDVGKTDTPAREVVDLFAKSMNGLRWEDGERLQILPGSWTPPVMTIKDADVGDEIEFSEEGGEGQNAVQAVYVNGDDESYEPVDAPLIKRDDYLAEDNGKVETLDETLTFINKAARAEYHAWLLLERERRRKMVTLSNMAHFPFRQLEIGDRVRLSLDRARGDFPHMFQIVGKAPDAAGVSLTLLEDDPKFYNYVAWRDDITVVDGLRAEADVRAVDWRTGMGPRPLQFGKFWIVQLGQLWRIDLDGGNGEKVADLPGILGPRGITYAGGRLYIADSTADELWRMNLDGGGGVKVADLPAGLELSAGITHAGGRLYIVDQTGNELWRMNLDGGNGEKVSDLAGGLEFPRGITFADGRLYIVDQTGNELWQMDLDGGNGEKVADLPGGLEFPTGITFADGRLYIIDNIADELWRIDLDGGNGVKVAALPGELTSSQGIAFSAGRDAPSALLDPLQAFGAASWAEQLSTPYIFDLTPADFDPGFLTVESIPTGWLSLGIDGFAFEGLTADNPFLPGVHPPNPGSGISQGYTGDYLALYLVDGKIAVSIVVGEGGSTMFPPQYRLHLNFYE